MINYDSEYDYNFQNQEYWINIDNVKYTNADEISIDSNINEKENNKVEKETITYSIYNLPENNSILFQEGIDSDTIINIVHTIINLPITFGELKKIKDVILLRYQDIICSYLLKYIVQNNQHSFDIIISCLLYLYNVSCYLTKKINLKPLVKDIDMRGSNNLSLCSYKFCINKDCCIYNYPELSLESTQGKVKKNKYCYSDHFVHNKVAKDIKNLIEYININEPSNNINQVKEIIKSINTITYVIRHMYEELYNLYVSLPNSNYEKYHRNLEKKNS